MSSSLPPGPSYPSSVQLLGFWTRPLPYLERLRARYGKRFTLRLPLTPPLVHITDPAEVKQIYTAPADVLHPGAGARILEPVVGKRSVILLDGAEHMAQRKLMLPAFHGDRMERLTDLVTEVAEREIAGWGSESEVVVLHPRMQALTLEIILRAVFGLDPGPRLDAMRERLAKMLAFGDNPMSLFGQPPDWLLPLFERLPMTAGFFRDQARVDELLYELIDERRAEGGERDDVLSMLLAARHTDGEPMSREEVRDELLTLLVAGHETTASALAWAFERLVATPPVLARLVDEISTGDAYLTATIQETLRIRPVLPNTAPRLVRQPIEVGGWHYEPGVALVANAYLVHHDPNVYPDPRAFRPERFLDQAPGTYTWIPFGGGRRRCLGASFALLEMKIVIRSILERYDVRAASSGREHATRRAITVTPHRGARVALGTRTRAAEPVAA